MKRYLYPVIVLALAAAVLLFGPLVVGRTFTGVEVVVIVLTGLAMIARWQLVLRRRARRQVEEMRDSALW